MKKPFNHIGNFLVKFLNVNPLSPRGLNILMISLFLFIVIYRALAATPNPGQSWTEVGDGVVGFSTPTSYHTYTLPDATSTIMTTLNINQGDILYGSSASTTTSLPKSTTATQYLTNTGASNNPAWGYINLSNGVSNILSAINGGTGNAFTNFTGPTSYHTYTLPDATTTILTNHDLVTLAQGGTSASLTASNGGIVYSTATAFGILSGTSTAGLVLQSGTSSAPFWSSAVYPTKSGAISSLIVSDGTNFVTQDQSVPTVPTISPATTGAINTATLTSSTNYNVGLFNVPETIVVNSVSSSIGLVLVPANIKMCVYDISGKKLIDVTTNWPSSYSTLTQAVSPAVTLTPGYYYFVNGCASGCLIGVDYWVSTNATPLTTRTPTGKKVYEGTVTMSSGGTCNTTLPAISSAISSTPVGRLDN